MTTNRSGRRRRHKRHKRRFNGWWIFWHEEERGRESRRIMEWLADGWPDNPSVKFVGGPLDGETRIICEGTNGYEVTTASIQDFNVSYTRWVYAMKRRTEYAYFFEDLRKKRTIVTMELVQ